MGINNFTPSNPNTPNPPTGMPPLPNMPNASQNGQYAQTVLINYNQKFAKNGHTLYREPITKQLLSVLIGKTKPNALLIGPAGVGKTKIIEDLAFRIVTNDLLIPNALKDMTIYELPLSNLVADGGPLAGHLEECVNDIIDFAENPSNKAIIFIDEIHQLTTENSMIMNKIAQTLKPALARGNMHIIGATTTQESSEIANDPAFSRRFSKILVDELTKEQTVEILNDMQYGFFNHYNNQIAFTPNLSNDIVKIIEDFPIPGSHRPDNALTLLDRSIGEAIMQRQEQIKKAQTDPNLQNILNATGPIVYINPKIVKQTAIRLATGNSCPETIDFDELKNAFSVIEGQDAIITKLIRYLKQRDLQLLPKTKPLTLLFVGPSGVGKSEISKILAKQITGCKPIVLNMTEFKDPATINKLIGAPPGYVGYSSNAELPFDCLESNPYQVILLDEFEKCDASVKTLFMQIFEEGTLKTNKGKTLDFSKTIIIATSNAGHQTTSKKIGFGNTDIQTKTSVKELSNSFDIALLNRFSHRLTFQPISRDCYKHILAKKYEKEVALIKETKPRIALADTLDDATLETLTKESYEPDFGARPANQTIDDYILDQVI